MLGPSPKRALRCYPLIPRKRAVHASPTQGWSLRQLLRATRWHATVPSPLGRWGPVRAYAQSTRPDRRWQHPPPAQSAAVAPPAVSAFHSERVASADAASPTIEDGSSPATSTSSCTSFGVASLTPSDEGWAAAGGLTSPAALAACACGSTPADSVALGNWRRLPVHLLLQGRG